MTLTIPRGPALTAGLAVFAMAGLAPLGLLPVESLRQMAPVDLAGQIAADTGQLRLAAMAWMGVAMLDILVAWGLYRALADGAPGLAELSGWFRLAYAALLAAMATHIPEAARVVEAAADADPAEIGSAALQALNRFHFGFELVLIVFAVHLLLLAAALFRHAAAPRWLGVLIGLAGAGYLIDALGQALVPGYGLSLALYVFVGELVLAVWLIWTALRREQS